MAENMIDRRRQQLGMSSAPGRMNNFNGGMGSYYSQAGNPTTSSSVMPSNTQTAASARVPPPYSSHTSSSVNPLDVITSQDQNLETFINLLSYNKSYNPTVPTALSRRILNRQGCGFQDPNVAAVVSIAADQFLATVLSQSIACRDMRIRGEDIRRKNRKEESIQRKKRRQWYDLEEKKSNNKILATEKKYLDDIKKADAIKSSKTGGDNTSIGDKSGSAGAKAGDSKSKTNRSNKKKTPTKKKNENDKNDEGDKNAEDQNDKKETVFKFDRSDICSIKEDLQDDALFYAKNNYDSDESFSASENEDEEEDDDQRDILLLRDVADPLKAWKMNFHGKIAHPNNSVYLEKKDFLAKKSSELLLSVGENQAHFGAYKDHDDGAQTNNELSNDLDIKTKNNDSKTASSSAISASTATKNS
eukprot:CAMPEP_0178973156 /NCGR_PEP_ID=MMETSP0789-20121207/21546_1 /TAXON_ID=3005 /ORGANISM="Rhizosolenia setigera, Strain CCMP 1694" /LENGTH=416 /DNA_ID=CAMNT_0020660951 /DNA_START=16 /DNA_END=1266 /DNA_ORIENTATION=-